VFVRDGAVDLGGVAYDRHSSAAPKSNGTGRGVTWPADPILVVGAGGFIGGHLVAALNRSGFTRVRAVDVKPVESWY